MADSIFHLDADGELVEMREEPYESEDLLQHLLAEHPDLLAGAQINPDEPRKWLLVRREAGVPDDADASDRWAVDHLFVDQDGIPTLVEVKRSSDTRIRREVVGQMLDYAANAVAYWPAERIVSEFEATCTASGRDPEEVLSETFGGVDPEEFWGQVKTNLQAGKLRLLFVADKLPRELRRIIEFLNEQTDPLEVLGVEVQHFVGENRRTIVPRVIGQTAHAQQKKGSPRRKRKWTEEDFFEEAESNLGPSVADRLRRLLQWTTENRLRIWWGEGRITGSFYPLFDDLNGEAHYLFSAWTSGTVSMHFDRYARTEAYGPVEKRVALLERLNAIDGIYLPSDSVEKWTSFALGDLPDDATIEAFLAVWDDYLDDVRAGGD